MTDFNDLEVLASLNPTDRILVMRGGNPFQGNLGAVLGQNALETIQTAICQHREDTGHNGGRFLPNQWNRRPLNFFSGDVGQLQNGSLVLPAGRYLFQGWATSMEMASTQARLVSADGAIGWPSASLYSLHYSLPNPLEGRFTLASETVLELQHWGSRDHPKSWTYGYRTHSGMPEVYASILFIRY